MEWLILHESDPQDDDTLNLIQIQFLRTSRGCHHGQKGGGSARGRWTVGEEDPATGEGEGQNNEATALYPDSLSFGIKHHAEDL